MTTDQTTTWTLRKVAALVSKHLLTFLVAADHVVPVEAGEVALDAEAEAVARPLQHPALVLHLARQRHVLALVVVGNKHIGLPKLS